MSESGEDKVRWYVTNKYNAAAACDHCEGIITHEPWCVTINLEVIYAFAVVVDANILSSYDKMALHAFGILWCNTDRCLTDGK